LRRAARPRRTDARAAEEGCDRLRDVREVGGDAVPSRDAGLAQSPGYRPRVRPQLAPRPFAQRSQLGGVMDRYFAVVAAAEDVLRIAELSAREPPGPWHLVRGEHALIRHARLDLEELPDRRPEILELVDRPLPEVVIALEADAARLVEPFAVARDRRGRDPLR